MVIRLQIESLMMFICVSAQPSSKQMRQVGHDAFLFIQNCGGPLFGELGHVYAIEFLVLLHQKCDGSEPVKLNNNGSI